MNIHEVSLRVAIINEFLEAMAAKGIYLTNIQSQGQILTTAQARTIAAEYIADKIIETNNLNSKEPKP